MLVNLSGLPCAPPSLRHWQEQALQTSIVSSRWSVGGVTERNVATRGAELRNFPGDRLLPVLLRVVDQLPEMQHMFKSNYG